MPGINKVILALVLFCSVILFGTIGYVILMDAGPIEAFFMTMITVSTVGYEEVVPLRDPPSQIFTSILILAGIASTTLLTVTFVAFLVEGELGEIFRHRAIQKRINKMKDHFIVCGIGQAGRAVLTELMAVGHPFIVIEKNPDAVSDILEKHPDLPMVTGDATRDDILEDAGVSRARGLIAATESDSDNLLIALTARSKNSHLVITTRATRAENYNKMRVAGANHVVMPNMIGGVRMAATLLRPKVVDFLDVMVRGSGETFRMEEAEVPKNSPYLDKTLLEAEIPKKTGLLILAIKRDDGQYVFSPSSNEVLLAGDVLIVLGPSDKMNRLNEVLKGK